MSMIFLTKATQHNYKDVLLSYSIIYFFTFLTSKFLSFLSNLLSIENDLSTAAEVGWAFCNSAYLVGSIVKLVQLIIVFKSELDNRLLM